MDTAIHKPSRSEVQKQIKWISQLSICAMQLMEDKTNTLILKATWVGYEDQKKKKTCPTEMTE